LTFHRLQSDAGRLLLDRKKERLRRGQSKRRAVRNASVCRLPSASAGIFSSFLTRWLRLSHRHFIEHMHSSYCKICMGVARCIQTQLHCMCLHPLDSVRLRCSADDWSVRGTVALACDAAHLCTRQSTDVDTTMCPLDGCMGVPPETHALRLQLAQVCGNSACIAATTHHSTCLQMLHRAPAAVFAGSHDAHWR
jgi:hypothetical protein